MVTRFDISSEDYGCLRYKISLNVEFAIAMLKVLIAIVKAVSQNQIRAIHSFNFQTLKERLKSWSMTFDCITILLCQSV